MQYELKRDLYQIGRSLTLQALKLATKLTLESLGNLAAHFGGPETAATSVDIDNFTTTEYGESSRM